MRPTKRGQRKIGSASETRRVEDELRLLQTLAVAIGEAEDLPSAFEVTLRKVCEETGWILGQAWVPRADGSAIDCTRAWHASVPGLERFREASAGTSFLPGIGLPGRVWSSKAPAWIRDVRVDGNFPRAPFAQAAGLKGAMGIPVLARHEVAAVLEFFVFEPREEDEALVRLVSAVAAQLGSLVQRRRAEEALRRERDFVYAIMEGAGGLVAVTDTRGHMVRFNRACERTSGYTLDDLRGRPFWEVLVPPDEIDAMRESFQRLEAAQLPIQHENDWLTKDGRRRRIVWTNTGLVGPDGRLAHIIGTGIDVTEQRVLEQRFRQSQRLETVGRLAGGVAHDFNNMLSAILGYSELILKALRADDPLRADVQEVRAAAQRGVSLTRQLVAFSRGQVMQPRVLDLNQVVTELERMLRRLIGEDLELVSKLASDLGLVRADPGQMQQLLMNLAVNARDAIQEAGSARPKGGRLTIVTSNVEVDAATAARHVGLHAGPHVRLVVADTGVGMDEVTLSHLFEPFFTTREGGTGLGLSTVYGIVKQSGGHIGVESEIGKGSRFTVWLPRIVEEAPLPRQDEPHAPTVRGTETILLVEDDPSVRQVTGLVLLDAGYRVIEAASGPEAIEASRRHDGPIHLVVTDVVMPKMGGRELVQRLGAERAGMKALYVSAHTPDDAIRSGVPAGEVNFVQKPYEIEGLLRKVREALERR